jgi:RNA polymerase sigma factor (sigma-70 family)
MGKHEYLCPPHVQNTLAKIKIGDDSVIRELFTDCRDRCIAWACRNWHLSNQEAEEIYMQAFSYMYENIAKGTQLHVCIHSYIITIMKNMLCRHYKDQKQFQPMPMEVTTKLSQAVRDDLVTYNNWEDMEAWKHCIEIVKKLIDDLGDICSKLIRYHFLRGLTDAEIGERLGITANYVRVQRFHCMNTLRNKVKIACPQ